MYAIRRTIAAFVLGALIFGAPYVVAAPPVPTLAQVLASGNDPGAERIVANTQAFQIAFGSSYLNFDPVGVIDIAANSTATAQVLLFGDGSGVWLNGDRIVLPILPMVDPHLAGQLWNDAGTVKVSAG